MKVIFQLLVGFLKLAVVKFDGSREPSICFQGLSYFLRQLLGY